MTLRKQTFSAVRWTTFSSIGQAFLQITQIAIMARLLAPTDFGLIALVTSIMVFLQIFADAGISNAIIHNQNISQNQLSSLYWLNVVVSLCLALLLIFSSHWIATWYAQPELKQLLLMAACTLVISALSQQLRVLAQKNLRFAELTKIEISASCLGFIVAVTAAYNGAGVYSIIEGSLTTATVGSVLVWYRLAGGWRPQLRFNFQEIRQFLAFGAYMIGNNLANTINSQIDIMLGGKILGPLAIGLYSVPKNLNLRIAGVISPIVTNVGLPVMASVQNDRVLLKRVYLQTMRMTASINFPIYIALTLLAPEVVHTLLGSKWEEAIPLLRIFAVWSLVRSTGNPVGSLLMACGRADLSFKWNIVLLMIITPLIWVSSYYGVLNMAMSMAALMALLYWPNWYFLVSPLCGASFIEYSVQVVVPLMISIVAGIIVYISVYALAGEMLRLITGIIIGGFVYCFVSLRFNRSWVIAMHELVARK